MIWNSCTSRAVPFWRPALVAAAALVLPARAAEADACMPTAGCGTTEQAPACPDCAFEGTADLIVNGEMFTVDVSTLMTGAPTPMPDGTLHATTSHTITFPSGGSLVGQFTTTDSAVLTPTTGAPGCTYDFQTSLMVTGGTGDFAFASGTLQIDAGQLDLCAGTASWCLDGEVCLPGPVGITPQTWAHIKGRFR